MQFYKRWIGDYGRDTGHLSLAEHGAYSVLLDHYYATARALPDDLTSLWRIARAATEEERAAVARVADEFFPLDDDGLRHNRRADAEIVRAAAVAEAARKAANTRWSQR